MISKNYDINEFLEAIKDEDYFDIIYMADKEATQAERNTLRYRNEAGKTEICGEDYTNNLKDLIFFLKYAVASKKISDRFAGFTGKFQPNQ
ncbi:MAG: hypothetical protein PVF37_18180 [Desulfobacterales bacterium]|jgi:hypothetical protein